MVQLSREIDRECVRVSGWGWRPSARLYGGQQGTDGRDDQGRARA
jgi:hypothetical protein